MVWIWNHSCAVRDGVFFSAVKLYYTTNMTTKARTSKTTSKSRVTRAGAKSSSAKTAKKKAPRCRLIKFEPLPREDVNLAAEFIRLGQSVGGVDLKLPPRNKPRTFKPRVTPAEAESSSAKTVKKKAPRCRRIKFKPLPR